MTSYNIKTDRAYLPPRAELIPIPALYSKMKDHSHQWSTCYPAWNLQYYVCLASLKTDRANVIVETGTNHGCSAALLAQTLVETKLPGHVHTFEIDPERANKAQKLFNELNLSKRITLHLGDSIQMLPKVITSDVLVDFAFIDANHATEACLAETELVLPNVIAGKGKLYFDNTWCGPVDVALCELKRKYGTAGWVDFPNCSRNPNGQAVWQPWQRLEPIAWHKPV